MLFVRLTTQYRRSGCRWRGRRAQSGQDCIPDRTENRPQRQPCRPIPAPYLSISISKPRKGSMIGAPMSYDRRPQIRFFPIFGDFLFPDWYTMLQLINPISASFHRFFTMFRRDGHNHSNFSDFQFSNPVFNVHLRSGHLSNISALILLISVSAIGT